MCWYLTYSASGRVSIQPLRMGHFHLCKITKNTICWPILMILKTQISTKIAYHQINHFFTMWWIMPCRDLLHTLWNRSWSGVEFKSKQLRCFGNPGADKGWERGTPLGPANWLHVAEAGSPLRGSARAEEPWTDTGSPGKVKMITDSLHRLRKSPHFLISRMLPWFSLSLCSFPPKKPRDRKIELFGGTNVFRCLVKAR